MIAILWKTSVLLQYLYALMAAPTSTIMVMYGIFTLPHLPDNAWQTHFPLIKILNLYNQFLCFWWSLNDFRMVGQLGTGFFSMIVFVSGNHCLFVLKKLWSLFWSFVFVNKPWLLRAKPGFFNYNGLADKKHDLVFSFSGSHLPQILPAPV